MNFITKLNLLKSSLYSKVLNLKDIKKQIDQLANYRLLTNYTYLNNLLHPETVRYAKIPSKIPINSTCFHLNKVVELTTNAKGCMVVYFNPDFLKYYIEYQIFNFMQENADGTLRERAGYSTIWGTFWWNAGPDLDGEHELDIEQYYSPVNAGQTIPPFYSSYRLVSGCMTVKYIDSIVDASGTIGGAVVNKDLQYLAGRYYFDDQLNPFNPGAQTYALQIPLMEFGDFKNIRACPNSQEYNCIDGLRLLYYPIDNSYKEFTKVYDGSGVKFRRNWGSVYNNPICIAEKDVFKGGFAWAVYVYKAQPYSKFLFTIDLNFECLLDPIYESYLPTTVDMYDMTPQEECDVIQKIRLNTVQKLV